MTCANWLLTAAVAVIAVMLVWPVSFADWIIAVACVVILIVAWSGCDCRYCKVSENKQKRKRR